MLNDSYVMKNHVALVGGFVAGSYDQSGETRLNGNNDDLDRTALFYGVVVTNGNKFQRSGMYNKNSSPTLINVTFSSNRANHKGGGIFHAGAGQPFTLINTILWNNNNGNIYFDNDSSTSTKAETVYLYPSLN